MADSPRCGGSCFAMRTFAALYGRDIGRSSVLPNLLATALLLQGHDRVSDAEAPGLA